jgi:hypothetical protein
VTGVPENTVLLCRNLKSVSVFPSLDPVLGEAESLVHAYLLFSDL